MGEDVGQGSRVKSVCPVHFAHDICTVGVLQRGGPTVHMRQLYRHFVRVSFIHFAIFAATHESLVPARYRAA